MPRWPACCSLTIMLSVDSISTEGPPRQAIRTIQHASSVPRGAAALAQCGIMMENSPLAVAVRFRRPRLRSQLDTWSSGAPRFEDLFPLRPSASALCSPQSCVPSHLPPSHSPQYTCVFCGKTSVKRKSAGIWNCGSCDKVQTGGAYMLATAAAATVRSNIARLRKAAEEA
jgi:hypothetical protein